MVPIMIIKLNETAKNPEKSCAETILRIINKLKFKNLAGKNEMYCIILYNSISK
jgi:hypothetical protein